MSLDHTLQFHEKLRLIEGIQYWQQERKKRLQRQLAIRHDEKISNAVRILIGKEIELIRSQDRRLQALKQSLNN